MKEYDSFLHDKYLFYYYNILVLNYAKKDKDKALYYLNKASKSEKIKKLPAYYSFIYLNRSLIYYFQKNYKKSQIYIARLVLHVDFLLLDKLFQLKILVTELMIRFMISSKNIINEKIKSIKNDYGDLLNDENHIREKKIIDLISEKNNNKLNVNDKIKFLSYITDSESEDIDILSYNIWVKENIK